MRVDVVPVTQFAQNCMVVYEEPGGPGVVIDPGGEVPRILDTAGRARVTVKGILVTHGHFDHIGGLEEIVFVTGARVWYHPDDLHLFENPGMGLYRLPPIALPDEATAVGDGGVVEVAGMRFDVLHTPGHTPGSVSFLADGHLFCGDLLFAGSVGRTDFPGGDFATLARSVEEKVWPLPDATNVLPGHGPATTVGREKQSNPFVGAWAR